MACLGQDKPTRETSKKLKSIMKDFHGLCKKSKAMILIADFSAPQDFETEERFRS